MGVFERVTSFPAHWVFTPTLGSLLAASSLPAQEPATAPAETTPLLASLPARDSWPAISRLDSSKNFAALSAHDQETVRVLYHSTLPRAAAGYFKEILDRNVGRDQHCALIDRDFFGGRLLDTLAGVCAEPMHPALEAERALHLTTFLKELSRPGELDQTGRGMCGASFAWFLNTHFPGEAARHVAALLSVEGTAKLKLPGVMLVRPRDWELPYAKPGQTMTEMLQLGAYIEVANGPEMIYCAHCDRSYNQRTGAVQRGIDSPQQGDLWNAVFGTNKTVQLEVEDHSADYVFNRMAANLPDLCAASLRWKTRERTLLEDIRHAIPGTEDAQMGRHLLNLAPAEKAVKPNVHIVIVTGIIDGPGGETVHFRNLHGPEPHMPNGTVITAPRYDEPRATLIDNTSGIWSLPVTSFKQRLRRCFILNTSELNLNSSGGVPELQ